MPRPLRTTVEKTTEKIPRGPWGVAGKGNITGAIGFSLVEIAGIFIPGSELDPGFNIESQSVERSNGQTVHTFVINAASKNVARFAAKFESAPSNIDFATMDTDVISVEPITERSTFSTYRVIVEVSER